MIVAAALPGFARQHPWLGRLNLGVPPHGALPPPKPLRIYAGETFPHYQFPPPAPGESSDITDLALNGARLTVEIGVPASVTEYYTSRGQAPPVRQTVRALIDTGASISGVKPEIAKAAGLIQTSSVGISGVVGTQERPVYTAGINLPDYNVSFDTMDFAGVDLPQQDIGVLIGRDVLKHTVLTYAGKFGSFSIQDGEGPLSSSSTLLAGGIVIAAGAALALFA